MLMTQKAFASKCGVTSQSVSQALKLRKLTRHRGGKIDDSMNDSIIYFKKNNKEAAIGDLHTAKLEAEVGKLQADRKLREIKIDIAKDLLIEKEKVASVIFTYLDALNINILASPDLMADYLIDMIKSGSHKGDIVAYMREILGAEIKSTKAQVLGRIG